jgi:hypothetical protein
VARQQTLEDAVAAARRTTLAAVRRWPPTVSVEQAEAAMGISRASAYAAIADESFPVRTIRVGRPGRIKVLTASLVAILEGRAG